MQLDVWSDLVCPWCYVGKRNLEAALAQFEHADEVTVRWRSWELDPSAPTDGSIDLLDLLARKYRTDRDGAQRGLDRVADAAAEVGLEYRFDLAVRANTFDAHRLVHLGTTYGVADAVKERFFRGYFCEGANLADQSTLLRLATEAGLDAAAVDEVLRGTGYADAVRADEELGREVEVSGVPFFHLDGVGGIGGAHPPELLLRMLRRAYENR